MTRVVVTGMSVVTALGQDWQSFEKKLKTKESAVVYMSDWEKFEDLNTKLAAPVKDFEKPSHFTRKKSRSMGRVSMMATYSAEKALEQANLIGSDELTSGVTGVSYGSSTGSVAPLLPFSQMLVDGSMNGVTATSYIQMMPHTAPVNIAVYFGTKGRVHTTSSACTSGSQGIGYAYEAIKMGKQKIMIAGGAEELCPTEAAVFDTLYATSIKNDKPSSTPRPFDRGRDGLVIGEGAGTLILEEYEHAKARGASILAEIVGFGTNSDGMHVTQPEQNTMRVAMELALADANLDKSAIGYVNAHGTATDKGDIAESNATAELFGKVPISSLKSYLGHTLGACGAIEAWACINMLNNGWFAPTLNLDNVDPLCGELDYITGHGVEIDTQYVMSNNFAFGGINTSLIFKKWDTSQGFN